MRVEEEDVVLRGQLDPEELLAARREAAEHPHGYFLELLHRVLRAVGLDEVYSEVDVLFENFLESEPPGLGFKSEALLSARQWTWRGRALRACRGPGLRGRPLSLSSCRSASVFK